MSKQHLYFLGLDHPTMAGMAVAVKRLGFSVSGSVAGPHQAVDQQLSEAGIHYYSTNQAQHVDPHSLLIVAPHIKKDNPELKMAQKMKLEIVSLPQLVQQIAQNQQQIVVIGSSSLAAAIASVLQGTEFSADLITSQQVATTNVWTSVSAVHFSAQPWLVIDGQTQPASILDKATQWLYFQPRIIVVAHQPQSKPLATFYKDLQHLCDHAQKLPDHSIQPTFVIPDTDKQALRLAQQTGIAFVTYGSSATADWQWLQVETADHQSSFNVVHNTDHLPIQTDRLGLQAVAETTCALVINDLLSLSHQQFLTNIGNFNGLYDDQRLHASINDVRLLEMTMPWTDDAGIVIAHLRQRYLPDPAAKLWLVGSSAVSKNLNSIPGTDVVVILDDLSAVSPKAAKPSSSPLQYRLPHTQAAHFMAQHLQPGDLVCHIHTDWQKSSILRQLESALAARQDQA